ncbi:MAG: MBL fold metallo-hydrolase [Bernardetiaceae bacterium]|jgi:phosphoribosyl 1,2-cyclic phosphate phosphodiesterase|nr:MBL fold metallo-hydrolase [Bernardetiaceae bacterium]
MKVTFLGTGTSQGIPVIACACEVCRSLDFRDKRLRTSIHVEVDGQSLVVDTGPDFRQQMLRHAVGRLDAVLFTHQHKDHTAGLDDVRAYNFKQAMDMPVYARREVLEHLRQEFPYIFAEHKYPGIPSLQVYEIRNEPFWVGPTQVRPILVMHHRMPVFGFRIGDFTYITDTNHIPEEEQPKIAGSRVLVLDALHHEAHLSHFNLEQALAMIERLRPERAYLIHLSHRMGRHAEVSRHLPTGVQLAYDGLVLEV